MPASTVPQKATPQPPQEALQQAPQEAQAATSLLETAVFLHKQGLALLPIRPRTKEPHKDVLKAVHGTSELRPLTRRRASLPEVAAWFGEDENCQLAVFAGAASGNIAFVDVDDPDAAADLVRALYALGGPVTITPRPGLRFWFRQKEPIPARKLTLPDGRVVGEVLTGYNAAGKPIAQYVVVPPSVHPSGKRYFWMSPQRGLSAPLPELDADELDELLRGDVAEPPADAADADADAEVSPPFGREVSEYEYSYLLTLDDSAKRVEQLQRSPAFIEGALRVLGLAGVRIGQAFKCVLPGHAERRPSAALFRLNDGSLLYHDFHGRDGDEWFTLTEVFAAVRTGRVRRLRGRPEHVVWTLRLAVEAGVIEPAKVEAPEPPADLKPAERKLYAAFVLLLGCKWLYEPGAPTVFTWRFAAAWSGLSERHAGEAMKGLLRRGLIRKVGEHYPARGRPQALFLPGLAVRSGGRPKKAPGNPQASTIRAALRKRPVDKPSEPCPVCGGRSFWTVRRRGEKPRWVCSQCLPPPHERVLRARAPGPRETR